MQWFMVDITIQLQYRYNDITGGGAPSYSCFPKRSDFDVRTPAPPMNRAPFDAMYRMYVCLSPAVQRPVEPMFLPQRFNRFFSSCSKPCSKSNSHAYVLITDLNTSPKNLIFGANTVWISHEHWKPSKHENSNIKSGNWGATTKWPKNCRKK